MRKLFIGIFVVLFAAPVFGGTPAENLAAWILRQPDRTIDLARDLNIKSGWDNASATRKTIQLCLEAARITNTRVRIVVPPDLYSDLPIDIPSYVTLDGLGVGSIRFPHSAGLSLGVDPAPYDMGLGLRVPLTDKDLVDTSKLLTGSFRTNFGVHVSPRLTIAELGGQFCFGGGGWWADKSAATFEFVYSNAESPDDTGIAYGWTEQGVPKPICFDITHSGAFRVRISAIANGVMAPTIQVTADAPQLKTKGVHRVSFQIDLADGTSDLWIDASRIPTQITALRADPAARFAECARTPFKIGGMSASPANTYSDVVTIAHQDAIVLGMAATPSLVYKSGADGRIRVDGRITNDATTFYDTTSETIRLLFNTSKTNTLETRAVCTLAQGWGTMYVLDRTHANVWNSPSGIVIQGLTINAACDAIVSNLGINNTIRNCGLNSEIGCGIGGWRDGTTYSNYGENLFFGCREAAIYLDYGIWTFSKVRWDITGRRGIWVRNLRTIINALVIGGNAFPDTESLIKIEGGKFVGSDIAIDIEGGKYPTKAAFDVSTTTDADNSVGVSIRTRDVGIGRLPETTPLFLLRQGRSPLKGFVQLDHWDTSGGGKGGSILLDVDDPNLWDINADISQLGPIDRFPLRTSAGVLLNTQGKPLSNVTAD